MRLAAIALATALVWGCLVRPAPPSTPATVCSIANAPALHANREIRIHAAILSDGIEHILLVDESCPRVGIVPVFSAVDEQTGGAALIRAISAGQPGTVDKAVSATFTGVFMWKEPNYPDLALRLTSVSDIVTEHSP